MLRVSCEGMWVIFNMTPFLTAALVGKQERKVKDQTPEAYLLCLMLWKYLLKKYWSSNMCAHGKREWLGKPRSQPRNRLPKEVVLAPSWGFLLSDWIKHRTACSDLRTEPLLSRSLDLVTSWGPSLPEFSCDPIRLWAALQGEETNLPASTSCVSWWLTKVDPS